MTDEATPPVSLQHPDFALEEQRPQFLRYVHRADPRRTVTVQWWPNPTVVPGQPPVIPPAGRPMVVESRRPLEVLGTTQSLLRTSTFEGVTKQVDVVILRRPTARVRVVLRGTDDSEADLIAAHLVANNPSG